MRIQKCLIGYFRRSITESMPGMVKFKGDLTLTSWNELSRRSSGIKVSMKTRSLWTDLIPLAKCEYTLQLQARESKLTIYWQVCLRYKQTHIRYGTSYKLSPRPRWW